MDWTIRDDILNSKIRQYELFGDIVPIPKYIVFRNIVHLTSNFAVTRMNFGGKFVVTSEYGDGGKTFTLVDEDTQPSNMYSTYFDMQRLRVTEYFPEVVSYSVHSVIGNNRIIISPIVRQIIEDNFLFRGVEYPCKQPWKIKTYTRHLSQRIRDRGYRGLCHFDFMETPDEIYFGEINPRYARSTPFVSWAMRRTHSHSLFQLDKMARKGEDLPFVIKYIDYISWKMTSKDGKIEFHNET